MVTEIHPTQTSQWIHTCMFPFLPLTAIKVQSIINNNVADFNETKAIFKF